MNFIRNDYEIFIFITSAVFNGRFMVTINLICRKLDLCNSTLSFLRNLQSNPVIIVSNALFAARIIHQVMQNFKIHTIKTFVNFFTSLRCIFVDNTFLVHWDTVLYTCNRHNGITADKAYFTACSILLFYIIVCNCTLFGYPVINLNVFAHQTNVNTTS